MKASTQFAVRLVARRGSTIMEKQITREFYEAFPDDITVSYKGVNYGETAANRQKLYIWENDRMVIILKES